jgi:translation initiation factor IF-1
MKKALACCCMLCIVILCVPLSAFPSEDRPGVVIANITATTAVVQAVDHAKRTVAVKRADGRIVEVKVAESVKNFANVKVGDAVSVEYYESIAMTVEKDGPPVGAGEASAVRVAPPGGKPGMTVVDTLTLTVTVAGIDYAKRTVTVKGPSGSPRTFSVSEDAKNFHRIKKGDEIVVRLTEAMAISVNKP